MTINHILVIDQLGLRPGASDKAAIFFNQILRKLKSLGKFEVSSVRWPSDQIVFVSANTLPVTASLTSGAMRFEFQLPSDSLAAESHAPLVSQVGNAGLALDLAKQIWKVARSGEHDGDGPPAQHIVETLDEERRQSTRQHLEGPMRAVRRVVEDGLLPPDEEAEVQTYLQVIQLHLRSPKPDQPTIARNIGLIAATLFKSGGATGQAVKAELQRLGATPDSVVDAIVSAVSDFVDSLSNWGTGSTREERTQILVDSAGKAETVRTQARLLEGYVDGDGQLVESSTADRWHFLSREGREILRAASTTGQSLLLSELPTSDQEIFTERFRAATAAQGVELTPDETAESIAIGVDNETRLGESDSVNVLDEMKKGAAGQFGKNAASKLTDQLPELVAWFTDAVVPLVQGWF